MTTKERESYDIMKTALNRIASASTGQGHEAMRIAREAIERVVVREQVATASETCEPDDDFGDEPLGSRSDACELGESCESCQ